MKNNLVIFLAFIIILLSVLLYVIIAFSNDLQNQVYKQDKLINNINKKDSVYISKTKKYSEIITKYVYECGIRFNNKKIGTAELVKVINKNIEENDILKDSVSLLKNRLKQFDEYDKEEQKYLKQVEKEYNSFQDTLFIYKSLANLYEKDYGIKYNVNNKKGKYYFVKTMGKADSALLLLPYYRNKIRIDSVGKSWTVMTDRKVFNKPVPPANAKGKTKQ